MIYRYCSGKNTSHTSQDYNSTSILMFNLHLIPASQSSKNKNIQLTSSQSIPPKTNKLPKCNKNLRNPCCVFLVFFHTVVLVPIPSNSFPSIGHLKSIRPTPCAPFHGTLQLIKGKSHQTGEPVSLQHAATKGFFFWGGGVISQPYNMGNGWVGPYITL